MLCSAKTFPVASSVSEEVYYLQGFVKSVIGSFLGKKMYSKNTQKGSILNTESHTYLYVTSVLVSAF